MLDRRRLEAIVRDAGRIALERWPGNGHELKVWEKSPDNPVCEADLLVDRYLRRELTALLPSAGWLSEESTDAPERLAGGLIWLVDPIDGTRDYQAIVAKALKNKSVEDFEDGVEYYSAIAVGCKCIVTEDTGDFFFSSVDVVTSDEFVEKYMR